MADEWTGKLDTYLDGELTTAEVVSLDAHLRGCSECTAEVLRRLQLKRAVQSAGRRFTPSAEFRQRIQAQVAPRKQASWRAWVPAAVLAVLLIAGVVAVYDGRLRLQEGHAYSELADLHVATLASSNRVDVVSSDRHTVKPWFQGKIPFTFNLPELQNSEFTLLGGRMAYLEQSPGVQLIYQIRKHEISVFIFQERAAGFPSATGPHNQLSFTVETWAAGGLRYFVIGDASREDVGKLSDEMKKAAGS